MTFGLAAQNCVTLLHIFQKKTTPQLSCVHNVQLLKGKPRKCREIKPANPARLFELYISRHVLCLLARLSFAGIHFSVIKQKFAFSPDKDSLHHRIFFMEYILPQPWISCTQRIRLSSSIFPLIEFLLIIGLSLIRLVARGQMLCRSFTN